MKKLILSASFAFALLTTSNTFAQQGFGTNQPDRSAAVDIVSSKRGLLIPRISIADLNQAAPVNQPANALFVYNTNSATGEGFYYWEREDKTLPTPTTYAGRWVRFTSSINEKNVIVTAGDNVQVDPTTSTDGLTTTYTVGVQGGTENGQVLVTKVDGATTTTEWVNPADFIQGINGITVEQVTDPTTGIVENVVKLGGTLTEDTTIITDGNKVMIQGLSQVTDMTDQVVAVGHYQTGEVKVATPGQIVSNTLTDGSGTTAVYDATTGKNQVDLGGKLTKPAVIETEGANTIAITGLNEVATADLTANDKIVIMGNDGVLKITSKSALLDAKDLTLGDGLAFETGIDDNDGVGAVLKATKIEIEDNSVKAVKLDAKGETEGHVATVNNDGTVTYQAITPASLIDKKTLTGDGITVTAGTTVGTDSSVADALLADVTLGIANGAVTTAKLADGAVTNQKLADGAVSSDKMTSFTDDNGTTNPVPDGYVPVADGLGNVTYQNVATAIGEDLTTDGKIVIVEGASEVTSLENAVLVPTELKIAANSITSADIQNGTIQPIDIAAPGALGLGEAGDENMVLVTDEDGNVTWVEQSDLANKDNYNFAAPLNKDAGTANTTGGLDYAVTIVNANATTVGVVREADTDPTVNVVDGVLSVNLTNTTLSGDVTGPLNATKVEAIQGTAVSATPPTAINNVLVYDNANQEWVPTELTGSHITGEALTSNSITVTPTSGTTNTALLEALNIEITPGTAEGQILTTVNTAAAGDPAVLSTNWATPNSLIVVDNGLNKDNSDVVELGGALKRVTEIEASATNTLAISGLQAATEGATNKVVVSEGATGILRTVERVVEGTDANVVNNSGYSFYTPEVVLNITLPATGDVTVQFPAAASAVGQVINIKIANTTESHTGYLNVLDTYGSMPYQGWIVKSNGSDWVIVGRN